jgi:uncharacterized protein
MPRVRQPRNEDGRRLWSAGHAVVVTWLGLVLASLLNAPGMHKTAFNQEQGLRRDVALAVTGPLAGLSGALQLDRPRQLVKAALGRSDDDEIDTEIAVPGPGTAPPPGPGQRLAFTPKRKLRLWVAGDSLVVVPGFAIVEAADASPVLEPLGTVDGRIATGLERPDVFDWFEHLRREVRRLRPKAVVVALGANDDHDFMTGVPEGVTLDGFGGPAWTNEYRRRVGGLMDTVTRGGAFLVWIGLPITRDPDQSARFDRINAIVQQEARRRPGRAAYVDTYTRFAGDDGGFAEYLPNAAGRLVRVRARDGVHFERPGGEIIAREVLRRLNEAYDLTSWRKRQGAG